MSVLVWIRITVRVRHIVVWGGGYCCLGPVLSAGVDVLLRCVRQVISLDCGWLQATKGPTWHPRRDGFWRYPSPGLWCAGEKSRLHLHESCVDVEVEVGT